MERFVDMKTISDGKLYGGEDMVRADCGGCEGCFACCAGMGNSIVLDPLDVHRLTEGLSSSFEQLLADKIELNVADGLILPNLKMAGEDERCAFLKEDGRCSIHGLRPGICRLFPLGRFYDGTSFRYFLQIHECRKENRSKVKVKKWLDTPDFKRYEAYIADWHYFLKDLLRIVREAEDEAVAKNASMYVLKQFYLTPYGPDFYGKFDKRLKAAKELFGGACS